MSVVLTETVCSLRTWLKRCVGVLDNLVTKTLSGEERLENPQVNVHQRVWYSLQLYKLIV